MKCNHMTTDIFRSVAAMYGTPCWIYDLKEISHRVTKLQENMEFATIRYAQKANSNIHILTYLRTRGVLVDAVSLGEIERATRAGYDVSATSDDVVYASDILDLNVLDFVTNTEIAVNAGSPQMLKQLGERSPGHRVWLRINPGFGSGFSRKTNTGGEFSKHGIWHEHLDKCYRIIDEYGLRLVGLHMHIGSGADQAQLQRVCSVMVEQVRKCPYDIKAISTGGGLSITHEQADKEFDVTTFAASWKDAKDKIEQYLGHEIKLEIEPGRYIVGNSGYLVSEVRAKKMVGSNKFILLDAGFNELVRPVMYGGYHEIELLPKDANIPLDKETYPTIVGGPLCEAGDVFTQDSEGNVLFRELQDTDIGSLAVFSDCGAYCSSMGSTYNSRPLAPEIIVNGDDCKLIRRRQDIHEMLALEIF